VLVVLHLMLMLVLHARPGVSGVVLWYVGPSALAALAGLLLFVSLVQTALHRLTVTPERLVRYLVLAAVASAPMLYRTYPSSHDGAPSSTRFVLPLAGPVTVAWGGTARDANLHVVAPDQRWGYDLLVTDDGRSFRGYGDALSDYLAYAREVLAPAAGTVRVVHDGEPDVPIGQRPRGDDLGNHVAIEVAPGEFLFLAHFQPGSITVKPGDRVAPGDVLGRVGNSGNSSEPHVHIHLQDTSRRHLAEGVPFLFADYCRGPAAVAEGMPTGGRSGETWTGAVIHNAPASGCPPLEEEADFFRPGPS